MLASLTSFDISDSRGLPRNDAKPVKKTWSNRGLGSGTTRDIWLWERACKGWHVIYYKWIATHTSFSKGFTHSLFQSLSLTQSHSLTHSHSLIHLLSLTHSITLSLTKTLIHCHSHIHSLFQSLLLTHFYSLTHSLFHLFSLTLTYSITLTNTPTHSLSLTHLVTLSITALTQSHSHVHSLIHLRFLNHPLTLTHSHALNLTAANLLIEKTLSWYKCQIICVCNFSSVCLQFCFQLECCPWIFTQCIDGPFFIAERLLPFCPTKTKFSLQR